MLKLIRLYGGPHDSKTVMQEKSMDDHDIMVNALVTDENKLNMLVAQKATKRPGLEGELYCWKTYSLTDASADQQEIEVAKLSVYVHHSISDASGLLYETFRGVVWVK